MVMAALSRSWSSLKYAFLSLFRPDGLIGALFSSGPSVPGDDPTLQQLLMLSAVFCGPVMFFVGGMLFWVIPPEHVRTKTWSFWNAVLSLVTAVWLISTSKDAFDRSSRMPVARTQEATYYVTNKLNLLYDGGNDVVPSLTYNANSTSKHHFVDPLGTPLVAAAAEHREFTPFEVLELNGPAVAQANGNFSVAGGCTVKVGFAAPHSVGVPWISRSKTQTPTCASDSLFCPDDAAAIQAHHRAATFVFQVRCAKMLEKDKLITVHSFGAHGNMTTPRAVSVDFHVEEKHICTWKGVLAEGHALALSYVRVSSL